MADPTPGDLSARLLLVAQAIKPIKGLQGMDTTVMEAIAALSALPAAGGEVCRFFASGPEGEFFANDSVEAERLIVIAGFDRDEWTITKLTTPQPSAAEDAAHPDDGCLDCLRKERGANAAVGAQGDYGPDTFDCEHAHAARMCGCGFCRALNIAAPAAGKGVDDAVTAIMRHPFADTTLGNIICAEISSERLRPQLAAALAPFLTRQSVAGDERVNVDHLRAIACEVENHRPQGHPSYGKYIVSEQFVRAAEKLAKMARNTDAPAATPTDGGEGKS